MKFKKISSLFLHVGVEGIICKSIRLRRNIKKRSKGLERAAQRNLGPLGPSEMSYLISAEEASTLFRSGESPSLQEGVLQYHTNKRKTQVHTICS